MITLCLFVSLALFLASLHLCGLVPRVKRAMATSREAAAVIRSSDLDLEEKETKVQAAALRMFGSFLAIVLGVTIAVTIPFAFMALATQIGLFQADEVMAAAVDTPFLVGSSLVTLVALTLAR